MADLHELGIEIVEIEQVGLVSAELGHGRSFLLNVGQLGRYGGRVKVLLAHQLVGVLPEAGHLLLLLGHQVLEGVVGLQVGLHRLNSGAAVRVGQGNLL